MFIRNPVGVLGLECCGLKALEQASSFNQISLFLSRYFEREGESSTKTEIGGQRERERERPCFLITQMWVGFFCC